jgi:Uma2 family endonuclease
VFRLSPTPISIEAYLRLEQEATERHELVGGQIYAMAGVSQEHSAIAGNIFVHLWTAGQNKPCRVHQESMKLRIGDTIYYPDVMVACQDSPHRYYENDPCALVEVLSKSTATHDLREKLLEYKRLASLQTYLIVDSETLGVKHFYRDGDQWKQEVLTGDGSIFIPCLDTMISLGQIYQNVFA